MARRHGGGPGFAGGSIVMGVPQKKRWSIEKNKNKEHDENMDDAKGYTPISGNLHIERIYPLVSLRT